jgi:hypothetical protein
VATAVAQVPATDAIADAHVKLMAGYARVLGEAEQMGRTRPMPSRERPWLLRMVVEDRAAFLVAPLLRMLVGAHVRHQLSSLATRYAQLELAAVSDDAREWLTRAREDAERVAGGLRSLRLPGLGVLVPVLVGLVTLATRLSLDAVPTLAWVITGFALAEIALLNFDAVPYAYRLKRGLMLTDATEIDRLPPAEQDARTADNLYADEDALFAAIGSAKKREAPLDVRSVQFVVAVLCAVLLLPLAYADELGLAGELWLAVVITCGVIAAIYVGVRRSRQWR